MVVEGIDSSVEENEQSQVCLRAPGAHLCRSPCSLWPSSPAAWINSAALFEVLLRPTIIRIKTSRKLLYLPVLNTVAFSASSPEHRSLPLFTVLASLPTSSSSPFSLPLRPRRLASLRLPLPTPTSPHQKMAPSTTVPTAEVCRASLARQRVPPCQKEGGHLVAQNFGTGGV